MNLKNFKTLRILIPMETPYCLLLDVGVFAVKASIIISNGKDEPKSTQNQNLK